MSVQSVQEKLRTAQVWQIPFLLNDYSDEGDDVDSENDDSSSGGSSADKKESVTVQVIIDMEKMSLEQSSQPNNKMTRILSVLNGDSI